MLLACFWFASMAAIIRHTSQHFPAVAIVFFRNIASLLCLLPWIIHYKLYAFKTTQIKLYCYRASSGLCSMYMLFIGLSLISINDAIALSFSVPLITTILAVIFLKEKVKTYRLTALSVGFIGVIIILRPGSNSFEYGYLLILATSFLWSISNILVKKLSSNDHPYTIIFFMLILTTPVSLLITLFFWQTPTITEWIWFFILGAISNQAQYAMIQAYRKTDINTLQPFDFSRLIFGAILSYIFFKETLNIWTLLGSAIIFTSSLLVLRREKKAKTSFPPAN